MFGQNGWLVVLIFTPVLLCRSFSELTCRKTDFGQFTLNGIGLEDKVKLVLNFQAKNVFI